jgi:ParB/RepB/Spo0J family partition protein
MSKNPPAVLQQIKVDKIDRNPDNPRLIFRSGELDELLESIRRYGVQVPIAVYRENNRFVLLDGERRWRCALKLNQETIPALVREKPAPLENLLLMFNIHALREQWDLLTIALKLPRIVDLLTRENGRKPTEIELRDQTGLNRAVIRRCKLLMALPDRYKDQILDELKKPKSQQKLTEDLFIEMERALTTVERALPEVIPDRDAARRVLIKKYRSGIINNRVLFRDVARIARAEKVGIDLAVAERELRKLFQDNNYKSKLPIVIRLERHTLSEISESVSKHCSVYWMRSIRTSWKVKSRKNCMSSLLAFRVYCETSDDLLFPQPHAYAPSYS